MADPPFIQTKTWRIDTMMPGDTLRITDRDVALNATLLRELDGYALGVAVYLGRDGGGNRGWHHQAAARGSQVQERRSGGLAGGRRRLYDARILAFDMAIARIVGTLSDLARGQGHAPGFSDIIIAATAQRHGLTILSRNLRHFTPLNVPVLDPFTALPPA